VDGLIKSRTFGTFSVNSTANMGFEVRQFLTPITSAVFYSVANKTGK
jgi:hypothetical protein